MRLARQHRGILCRVVRQRLAAAAGREWLALAAALAVVLVHLVVTPRPFAELKLIIAAAVIGWLRKAC